MEKTFICRFKRPDGYYTMLAVSGENLDAKKAERIAKDHIAANSPFKIEFVTAYEYENGRSEDPEVCHGSHTRDSRKGHE